MEVLHDEEGAFLLSCGLNGGHNVGRGWRRKHRPHYRRREHAIPHVAPVRRVVAATATANEWNGIVLEPAVKNRASARHLMQLRVGERDAAQGVVKCAGRFVNDLHAAVSFHYCVSL